MGSSWTSLIIPFIAGIYPAINGMIRELTLSIPFITGIYPVINGMLRDGTR